MVCELQQARSKLRDDGDQQRRAEEGSGRCSLTVSWMLGGDGDANGRVGQ